MGLDKSACPRDPGRMTGHSGVSGLKVRFEEVSLGCVVGKPSKCPDHTRALIEQAFCRGSMRPLHS